VSQGYKEDPKLGAWVKMQRTRFKNGIMDQEQKKRLEEIGFNLKDKANAPSSKEERVEEFAGR
jgi:hypothetical protein